MQRCRIKNSALRLLNSLILIIFAMMSSWAEKSRVAALKAREVNWRAGPGTDHPLISTYTCPGWPVLIQKQSNHWYLVRDRDGSQGWVLGSMLTFQHYALVLQNSNLYREVPLDKESAHHIQAYVQQGAIVRLLQINGAWALVAIDIGRINKKLKKLNLRGWILNQVLWPKARAP